MEEAKRRKDDVIRKRKEEDAREEARLELERKELDDQYKAEEEKKNAKKNEVR
jgi:hypothetical protein